ncbi:hypothetical protein [Tellurirhabdus rosea]|uniref:hypothetical protein n=1 Tax=Tellurirhabdus rosea TaxID=2674997 RepID=UPI0022547C43|nr:hypothetical protein [Tellurirhabdus rosea]
MLPIAFSHSFPAPVWRLLFEQVSGAPGRVLVEWRDGEARRLGISAMSLPEGQILSSETAELPWSSSVMGVWNGLALYHRLGNERLPVPTALGCFDPDMGHTRWEWPNHLLLSCDGIQVEARPTAPSESGHPSVFFDLQSGRPQTGSAPLLPGPDDRLKYPVLYHRNSQYWPVVDRFVKKVTGQTPFERLHYAEVGDKILFSYYVYTENSPTEAFLLVSDRQARIRLHQPLAVNAAGTGTDATAFCLWQNQLLVLTEPTQLTGFFIDE